VKEIKKYIWEEKVVEEDLRWDIKGY